MLKFDKFLNEMTDNNQNNQNVDLKLEIGDSVSVNGTLYLNTYNNATGTVRKEPTNDLVLIRFDDDDKNNKRGDTIFVPINMITKLNKKIYKIGDTVKCIDIENAAFYNQIGVISEVWTDDNSYMVKFGTTHIYMEYDDIELMPSEKKKIGFDIPNTNNKNDNQQKTIIFEEEEEEDTIDNKNVALKKSDLLEFSYKDFLLEDKISNIEDIINLKEKKNVELSNIVDKNPKNLKRIYIERSIGSLELIESYFQFLIHKIANDLPVLRTVEQIDDIDLIRNKTKVRASDSKEMTRKYSFDQGIIVYWKFKDAVVFKTI